MDDKTFERISQQAYKAAADEVIGDDLSIEVEDKNEAEEVDMTGNQPIDFYQEQRNERRQAKPVQFRGGKPRMKVDLAMLEDSALPARHKQAKEDSDYYSELGDRRSARMIRQQYMGDYFLPMVDSLVRMNSMESLLSSPDILSKLDSYALVEGSDGTGYTKSYISTLYAPTGAVERSDGKVQHDLMRIMGLCEDDEIRAAANIARDLKQSIDNGENMATSEDYELIEKVAFSV